MSGRRTSTGVEAVVTRPASGDASAFATASTPVKPPARRTLPMRMPMRMPVPTLGLALALGLGLGASFAVGPVAASDAPAAADAPRPRQLQQRAGELQLDGTSIRGSQELPRVLYILPWQDPGAAELAGRPFNSLIEDVLSPLDRDVFRRELGYHAQFTSSQSDADAGSAPEPDSGNQEVSRP